MLEPSGPPRRPQETIASSLEMSGFSTHASLEQVGFGPTRVASAGINAPPTDCACCMKSSPSNLIPRDPLPPTIATEGLLAPPPRASNTPPKVPALGMELIGPVERDVASTSINKLPAI